jgi:CIC family chloride channel protein
VKQTVIVSLPGEPQQIDDSRDFTVVGEDVVAYDVIDQMWRNHAFMAVVVRGPGMRGAEDVLGVITKEHVADSVASSLKIYPR